MKRKPRGWVDSLRRGDFCFAFVSETKTAAANWSGLQARVKNSCERRERKKR